MSLKVSLLQRPILLKLFFISLGIIFLTSCERTGGQYSFQQGNFEIKVINQLFLDFQKLEKQLPIRITYPDAEGVFPVVVFSHGNGSKGDMYKGFTDFWASHGYVVIQPTHMDSRSLGFETKRIIFGRCIHKCST